jgi:hypothetical protein
MSHEFEIAELREGGSPDGALLLSLLSRGARRWTELQAAGLDRDRVLAAVADLAEGFGHCVAIGPVYVSLVEERRNERWTLVLEAPTDEVPSATTVQRALKHLKRCYGLKCVTATWQMVNATPRLTQTAN